jgi:hypothetical protein
MPDFLIADTAMDSYTEAKEKLKDDYINGMLALQYISGIK